MVSMILLHFFVSKLLDDVLSGEWRGGEEEELEKNVCKMRWISLCCCPSSRCRHCNSQSVVVLLYTSSRGLGDHIYKLHYHMQPLCSSLCWKDSSSSILQDYQKLSLKCWSFFFSLSSAILCSHSPSISLLGQNHFIWLQALIWAESPFAYWDIFTTYWIFNCNLHFPSFFWIYNSEVSTNASITQLSLAPL